MLHLHPFEYLLSDRLTCLQWPPLELQPLLILWFRLSTTVHSQPTTPSDHSTQESEDNQVRTYVHLYAYISVKLIHVNRALYQLIGCYRWRYDELLFTLQQRKEFNCSGTRGKKGPWYWSAPWNQGQCLHLLTSRGEWAERDGLEKLH